jgi:predicted Zn-dependent peptidase
MYVRLRDLQNKFYGWQPIAKEKESMANKKMTKREMFAQILSHTNDEGEKAFILHEMELLDKKNSNKATKLTPAQEANEGIKSAIVDYLADCGEPMTISQMIKDIPQCNGLTNQKVSALVRQLYMGMTIKRVEVKGVAYFSIA